MGIDDDDRPYNHNREKTECNDGHPLSGDNLYITSKGFRQCKTCKAERGKESRERRARNRERMSN